MLKKLFIVLFFISFCCFSLQNQNQEKELTQMVLSLKTNKVTYDGETLTIYADPQKLYIGAKFFSSVFLLYFYGYYMRFAEEIPMAPNFKIGILGYAAKLFRGVFSLCGAYLFVDGMRDLKSKLVLRKYLSFDSKNLRTFNLFNPKIKDLKFDLLEIFEGTKMLEAYNNGSLLFRLFGRMLPIPFDSAVKLFIKFLATKKIPTDALVKLHKEGNPLAYDMKLKI